LRWLVGLLIALVLFAVLGFFAVPAIVKSQLQSRLSALLDREVTVQAVSFNPFTLEAELKGVVIGDKDNAQPLASFDSLYADASWASLRHRGPVLAAIRLTKPALSVIRLDGNRYNFSDIVEKFSAGEPAPEGPPPRFVLANIELVDGRVDFDDRPEHAKHEVTAINLGVPFVSSLPVHIETKVLPSFAATVNGDPFVLTGESHPFKDTLETTLRLNLTDVDLPRYLEYVPAELDFKLPSAKLAAELVARFAQPPRAPMELTIEGNGTLTALQITDKTDAPLVKLGALVVALKKFDLATNKLELASVTFTDPDVSIHRNAVGQINLERLAPRAPPRAKPEPSGAKPAAAAGARPFQLEIESIKLQNGRVAFLDETNARSFRTRVEAVELAVTGFSIEPGKEARYEASFKTDLGVSAQIGGALTLAPLGASGKVKIDGLKPRDYAPYYEAFLTADVTDGTLGTSGEFQFRTDGPAPALTLKGVEATVQALRVVQRADKQELLRTAKLNVAGLDLDLDKRSIAIASISASELRTLVQRARDGSFNFARLVASDPAAAKAASPAPAAKPAAAAAPSAAWTYAIKRIAIERAGVRYEDATTSPSATATVEPLQLAIDNVTSAKGSRVQLKLQTGVNKTGRVTTGGWLSFDPLATELALDVKALEIFPFEPYFAPFMNLSVSSGNVSTQGRLALSVPPNEKPRLTYTGDATLADLASTDKASSQDLLKWRSLFLGQIDFALEPLAVRIRDIALSDFFSRLIITPDGQLNLQGLLAKGSDKAVDNAAPPASAPAKPEAGAAAPSTPAAPPNDIKIGRVTLQGGTVDFSDFFVKPNYSANLTNLTGAVTEITPETAGDVDLRGRVNNTGALEIAGKLNPLAANLFLDIKAEARDIDLPAMTPYSAKYVGYGIEKGKLSVKVAYKVEDKKLTADNNVYLDQLTFGDKVESPDALKVPVLLAVALLKDRNGVIDINLPISGSLDDPEFSLGGIIVRVIVNLIVKAVTSPFALLSAAFGGESAELGYLEFEPGLAKLNDTAEGKLKTLGKALNDRPGLKLDVSGRTDPEADREGLRKAKVDQLVRAQKAKELARKGAPAASADAVTIEATEYPRFLTEVYRAADFPKPRNAIGMVRELPVPEMEKLLLTHTQVSDGDVRELANRRAQTAKDYLVEQTGIAAERIFIVAPKSGNEGLDDKGKIPRADFSLK
jgi:hypothetical protein